MSQKQGNQEKSALIVQNATNGENQNHTALLTNLGIAEIQETGGNNHQRSERPWCDHCKKQGHTK